MEGKTISSLPDFAEIFLFLQNLGPYMKLPGISLADLENFFRIVDFYNSETDQVAHIQKRLLRYAGAKQGANEWPHMAVKFGRKMGLLSEVIPYQDVSLKVRMKIFRCACEEQFDCNVNLRNVLKRDTPGMLSRPVGVDRNGVRYWLLQDSTFDVRLYGEGNYDEPPPVLPTWTLLAWSLDELADHISLLESRRPQTPHPVDSATALSPASPPSGAKATCEGGRRRGTPCVDGEEEEEGEGPSDGSRMKEKASGSLRKRLATRRPLNQRPAAKKSKKKAAAEVVEVSDESDVGGCLKCRKDSDHKKMLLCDTCDRECHTYCQYPVLWSIPRGKWLCPVCKEEQLLKKLREFYLHLSQSKLRQEQQVARKERSVARLQKSGVLLQNIILEENEGRRARRNRKEVNYAELNDVYLPPLGPRDFVGQDAAPMAPVRTRRNRECYIQEDYLAPRVRNNSRRYRGDSPTLAPLKEAEEEEEEEEGREEEKEDSLSSDGDSGQGIGGRNSVEGSDGDGLVMRLSVLHSSRLRDQRSSSCGEEEEEEEDVEVGVVSDRESDSLKHRTPNESGGEEEEEEEVEVDDSRSKGSLTADSNPASSSLDNKGRGSAQPSGRGSLQPRGHSHNETGSLEEGRGNVGYSSWDAGRSGNFLPGSDVFHRPGVLGSSPNWGVPGPYLMRGMAPIQSHTHFMAPIQNSHLIGGVAPRHQGPVGTSPAPHHHHLIKAVAPNLGPPPATAHPFWGVAPSQNPSPHLLHGSALPVVGSSNTTGSSNNNNIPDPHQHLNPGMKYMF